MDKNQIIETASRFLAKGAYGKAIKEYEKILQVDAKDARILQKLGELHQKTNDSAQATQQFMRAAAIHTQDGFLLKAVALYKQVLKIDPSLIDVNLRLAELHRMLRLANEATSYYQVVATHYDKQGNTRGSLEILKKIVDLDKNDVASRIKLGNLQLRAGLTEEAKEAFSTAAQHLKTVNRPEDYLLVAERLFAIDTSNIALARELAETYLKRKDSKRALAKLQVCFKADSHDINTLQLLATAFQELGQTSKAVSVYKEIAHIHATAWHPTEAEEAWQHVHALDPNDADFKTRKVPPKAAAGRPAAAAPGQASQDSPQKLLTETNVYVKYGLYNKALEHLRKIFAIAPENIDAHEMAYAIYKAAKNLPQAVDQLANVLRLHARSGDAERAKPFLSALQKYNPKHPELPAFCARLQGTGPTAAAAPEEAAPLEEGEFVATSQEAGQEAEAFAAEDAVLEAPVDGDAAPLTEDAVLEASGDGDAALLTEDAVLEAPVDGDAALLTEDAVLEASGDGDAAFLVEDAVLEASGDGDAAFLVEDDVLEAPVDEDSALLLEDDVLEAPVDEDSALLLEDDVLEAPVDEDSALFLEDDVLEAPGDEDAAVHLDAFEAAASTDSATAPLYVLEDEDEASEAPLDEAPATPLEEAAAFQAQPAQETAAVEMPAWAGAQADAEAFPTTVVPEDVQPDAGTPSTHDTEDEASKQCRDAAFFIEQGLHDAAKDILLETLQGNPGHAQATQLLAQLEAPALTPTAPERETAPAEASWVSDLEAPALTPTAPEGETAPTEASWVSDLANELTEYSQSEAAAPETAALGSYASDDEFQVSMEEVFSAFKKGLEKIVQPEDVDTHYDLGITYKEMGLNEDALHEFSIAQQGATGKRRELDCLAMIGLLQTLKGDFKQATDAFSRGLASEFCTPEVEKALRYDLAYAYERAGQPQRALSEYRLVQQLDANFRDVTQNIQTLTAASPPEAEAPTPPPDESSRPPSERKKTSRKIGYI